MLVIIIIKIVIIVIIIIIIITFIITMKVPNLSCPFTVTDSNPDVKIPKVVITVLKYNGNIVASKASHGDKLNTLICVWARNQNCYLNCDLLLLQMEAGVNEISVNFDLAIPLDRSTSSTKQVSLLLSKTSYGWM